MEKLAQRFPTVDSFKQFLFSRVNQIIPQLKNPIEKVTGRLVRDDKGLIYTFNLIGKVAENYYYMVNSVDKIDAVDGMFRLFSNMPGMANVRNVETVTAIDVTIAALVKSFIPFLAIERGLDAPSAQVYYRDIVALNTAGGVNAGDIVRGNFLAPNENVNLGRQLLNLNPVAGNGGPATINVGYPIIPGTVNIVSKDSANPTKINYTASDIKKDGKAYGIPGNNNGDPIPTITINYSTGTINISNINNGATVYVSVAIDTTGEEDGANTLKVTSKRNSILLETENIRLIDQESIEELNFINKIQAQIKATGAKLDYVALALRDLTTLYIEYINRRLVMELVSAAIQNTDAQVDISAFTVATSFAPTKDDFVNKFMIDLNQSVLETSGLGATCYVVGTKAANILMNIKDRFVALPEARTAINSVIGSYDGIPVIRHKIVDIIDSGNDRCSVYATYKDPNNESGALVYGEFLPMYLSGTALNYNNPAQYSRALFAQVGTKLISSSLVKRGVIKYA